MKKAKYSVILFSFIFAFFLWLSINLSNDFQVNLSVPLRIENLDSTKAIANRIPQALTVRVRGTGWKILNTLLTPSLAYTLDVGSVHSRIDIPAMEDAGEHMTLPQGMSVTEIVPDTITVTIDEKVRKRVALAPVVDAVFHEGFGRVGAMTLSPDSATVIGARSLLAMIDHWPAQPLTVREVKSAVNESVQLADPEMPSIGIAPSSALLHFDVQPIAEKTITKIPVTVNQLPAKRHVVLIPPTINIVVRSGAQYVASLDEKDISAYVEYRSVLLDTTGTIEPTIVCPEHIAVVRTIPARLQYVMRK
ncbi:MAG: YbbR-like domain-containing protein [Acidobacteriota bacterium]